MTRRNFFKLALQGLALLALAPTKLVAAKPDPEWWKRVKVEREVLPLVDRIAQRSDTVLSRRFTPYGVQTVRMFKGGEPALVKEPVTIEVTHAEFTHRWRLDPESEQILRDNLWDLYS